MSAACDRRFGLLSPAFYSIEDMQRQLRDVAAPVAKRRQFDFPDIQPIVKIFSEFVSLNSLAKVPVCGGDHSHIHLFGLASTDRLD